MKGVSGTWYLGEASGVPLPDAFPAPTRWQEHLMLSLGPLREEAYMEQAREFGERGDRAGEERGNEK